MLFYHREYTRGESLKFVRIHPAILLLHRDVKFCCDSGVPSACEFTANILSCSAPYINYDVNRAFVLCLADSATSVLIV